MSFLFCASCAAARGILTKVPVGVEPYASPRSEVDHFHAVTSIRVGRPKPPRATRIQLLGGPNPQRPPQDDRGVSEDFRQFLRRGFVAPTRAVNALAVSPHLRVRLNHRFREVSTKPFSSLSPGGLDISESAGALSFPPTRSTPPTTFAGGTGHSTTEYGTPMRVFTRGRRNPSRPKEAAAVLAVPNEPAIPNDTHPQVTVANTGMRHITLQCVSPDVTFVNRRRREASWHSLARRVAGSPSARLVGLLPTCE